MDEQTELIRSNCPRDCYDGCGMLIERRDGRIGRVLGDPGHPVSRGRLCGKCATAYNGVWQDPAARLQFPLRRDGPKGGGRFRRISWDEAMVSIADRLQAVIAGDGPDAVIHTHYSGTLSLIALLFPMRFFHRLGAAEVDPDTICNAAGHVAWQLMFGTSGEGFDPRTVEHSRCILIWGANPSHSGPHTHQHWFAGSAAKKIVVDPVCTGTAQVADLHLQPRPGSDAALAFSMLHVLRADGRFDDTFIDGHTLGFGEVLPLIEQCSPQWAERSTGVPAAKIIEAARLYGAGPALLWAGQGLQRQLTGGNIMRAIGLLPALTANIGKPGAGFYYLNQTPAIAGLDMDRMAGAQLLRTDPVRVSHMDFAAELSRPDRFKALLCWNTNPLASAPRQAQLRSALGRDDLFTVVIDCFQTDTADYADLILPAASFLEFDDLTFSYFHLHIGVQSKAREPMGESLPNQEIFRRLARAMNYAEPELYETDEALIAQMLNEMGVQDGFEGLRRRGWQPISAEPKILFDNLRFPTPSGRIEIASGQAEQMGLPRVPQPWFDAAPGDGRFRLITPASDLRLNDSYANDARLASRAGPPEVILHPDDAARLGISAGERVRLRNGSGAIELRASIEPLAAPGVLLSYKGRWPKLEATRSNVNVVHDGQKTDMGASTSVHSTQVMLERI